MSKVGGTILIVLVLLLLIGLIVWAIAAAPPVIFSYRSSAESTSNPTILILNPFRDRSPEIPAVEVLKLLRDGQCERATVNLPMDLKSRSLICQREAQNRLEAWTLRGRNDEAGLTTLYYRTRRRGNPDSYGDAFVRVELSAEGWRVVELDLIY